MGDEPGHADTERLEVAELADQPDERIDEFGCVRRRVTHLQLDVVLGRDVGVRVDDDTETFGAADVDARGERHAVLLRPSHDSARVFNSFKVCRMRTSARRLTNPGSGTINSICRE